MKVIVLAGGSGTRLWPLSSETMPKQFLSFEGKESLLQQTVGRFPQEDVLVITNQKHSQKAKEQLGPSYGDSILVEPYTRNTAPAICLSIKYLLDKAGGKKSDCCVVCPSDHYFAAPDDFVRLLPLANEGAEAGAIVTFGILPTYPETGYGYIHTEEGGDMLPVSRFVEKPCLEEARALLEEGGYYWNAGIFVFQINHFIQELKLHAPHLHEWMMKPYNKAIESFSSLPSISIDHALMEKTKQIKLIPYPSLWSDLGTWDRLAATLPSDEKGNYSHGEIEMIDTSNSIVFGDNISLLGVKDLLIVKNGEQVYVCHRDQMAQLPALLREKISSY